MILFDLSRLVSRASRGTPTGIDRVELAYAEHLLTADWPLCFTMLTPGGRFGWLPNAAAEDYLRALAATWRQAGSSQPPQRPKNLARRLRGEALLRREGMLAAQLRSSDGRPAYLLVSHHHLEKRRAIARMKRRNKAWFVCVIHDLIPIEYPEYALPGQDERHRRRIETAADLADAVIVNSAVTREAFRPYLQRAGRAPPVLVAPLGVELPSPLPVASTKPRAPYFVCVGTIEARKNHLLLLNVWRRLVSELGEAAPHLVLVGQRGWETEAAIDMIERCPSLRGVVVERNDLPDAEVAQLIKGARALLLPSFAEGFGFPLVEALALGAPVLCSNLPAFRENGGVVPDYLDPLDGIGWRNAVVDYADVASARRAAQLARLTGWRPPSWADHFAAVDALIAEMILRQNALSARPSAERRVELDAGATTAIR